MSFLDNLYRLAQVSDEAATEEIVAKSPANKKVVTAEVAPASLEPARILLIDDDPIFGKIMERIAKQLKLDLHYCRSAQDLGLVENWQFDVAVVDYDLGAVTGCEISTYLEEYAANLPLVMISNNGQTEIKGLEVGVEDFVHKKLGPYAIFKTACEISAKNRKNADDDELSGVVH